MFIIFKTLGNMATVFKLYKIQGINQMLISGQDHSLPMVIGMAWNDWCNLFGALSHNFALSAHEFQKIVEVPNFTEEGWYMVV